MKSILLLLLALAMVTSAATPAPQIITLPSKSPVVTLRLVFRAGSADDPPGKAGAAALTTAMVSEAGTKGQTYQQIVEAMFPLATSVDSQVDAEMITISAATHVDNLNAFYAMFRAMLLEPGWREEDLNRLRDNAINYLRVGLRGTNDEELGKEVLYREIFANHPYGHPATGTVSGLKALKMADLQEFYRGHFTRSNLIVGIAGGYPESFLKRLQKDLEALPAGAAKERKLPAPAPIEATRVTIVDKPTRSVAYSFGFPIDVRRGHPDYPALLVAQSFLGQHRMSSGRLFERMREIRGLNYGDYAYIEHFPGGMFRMEPPPNVARRQQIFQIWVRPVEPPTAHFALRLALHELDKLVQQGMTADEFERTRSFLAKNANVLTRSKGTELGYAIDSAFYGIPNYNQYLRDSLAKLTRDDVNRAIKKHLRTDRLQIAIVADRAAELKQKLIADEPSPMTYNSPKPDEIMAEDQVVQARKLGLQADRIKIVPVNTVFE